MSRPVEAINNYYYLKLESEEMQEVLDVMEILVEVNLFVRLEQNLWDTWLRRQISCL